MKTLITIFTASLLVSGSVCARNTTRVNPSSNNVTRTVQVSGFNEIEASRVNVEYTPGAATGTVTITAPENVMDYVVVQKDGNTLECSIMDGVEIISGASRCVTIAVTAPSVDEFEATLSAKIDIKGDIDVREFNAECSTSGMVVARNIRAGSRFDVDASTSGVITVRTVEAPEINAEASTSASVTIARAVTRSMELETTTSSTITVVEGTADYAEYNASTGASINAAGVAVRRGGVSVSTGGSVQSAITNLVMSDNTTGGNITNRP